MQGFLDLHYVLFRKSFDKHSKPLNLKIVETRQGSDCSLDATAKRKLGSGGPVYTVPCQQLLGYHWQPIKFLPPFIALESAGRGGKALQDENFYNKKTKNPDL